MMIRPLLATTAVVIGLVSAACGESDPAPTVVPAPEATTVELVGDWRPTPYRLAPAMRDRIGQACITALDAPRGTRAAVVDARGAGVATVRLTGVRAGACEAMLISPGGETGMIGGGYWGEEEKALPPPQQLGGITRGKVIGGPYQGNDPPDTIGWSVTGRAGAGIDVVTVEWFPDRREGLPLPDCTLTSATVSDGWFSAWCPARGAVTSDFEMQPG